MIKHLRFLFLTTLTLSVVNSYGQIESSELDLATLVNDIKLDDNFIYGEATMESLEGANALAQDFLKINIEQWVAENNESASVSKIDIGEVKQKCQRFELSRGTMFRSFVYVNKNNIVVSKNDLAFSIQIDTTQNSAVIVEPLQTVDTVDVAIPAEVVVESAAPVQIVDTIGIAVEAAAPVEVAPAPVAVAAAPVEVAPAPVAAAPVAVAAAPVAAPVADTVYIEVPVAAPVPDTVYIEVPVAAPAPVVVEEEVVEEEIIEEEIIEEEVEVLSPKERFEKDLIEVDNIGELVELFGKAEYQGCKYGDVNKSSIKDIDINNAYLVIYTPSDGKVKSILGQRLEIGVRLNLKSGKVDSTLNHKGSKATWVIFNEK